MSALSTQANAPERLFISGHSLVDQPLPSTLEAVAASLGTPLQWNRQFIVGSSILDRTRGRPNGAADKSWEGYRRGVNRSGEGLDVVSELRNPRTVTGGRYDTLLITEQHGLLGTLVWNDTVRHLRHYHDRLVEGNAKGRTWFYESWLGIDDKSDPRRWIAYERAASPVWQCIATRVNRSLSIMGRGDRIEPLPAGIALAYLVERATQGSGLAGISGSSIRETVDRIVGDDVHLTPLGSYYMALVVYSTMFDRSPVGAWAPEGVDAATASALQQVAWSGIQVERASRRSLTLEQCQSALQGEFIAAYWAYFRDAYWRREFSAPRAWWLWAKHRLLWHWRFRSGNQGNPLRYAPATDPSHWLPAP
jgi:hypothetical protein